MTKRWNLYKGETKIIFSWTSSASLWRLKRILKHNSNHINKEKLNLQNTPGLIYTTKGRDRFHWAATPLKQYKVGNICYMTYRYSVLYFLNLSLKHFPHNGNFCENIQIRRPLSFRVLTRSRMSNQRTSQSKIEELRCKIIKNCAKMKWALNVSKWSFPFFMCKHRQTTFGPTGALPVLCTLFIKKHCLSIEY